METIILYIIVASISILCMLLFSIINTLSDRIDSLYKSKEIHSNWIKLISDIMIENFNKEIEKLKKENDN